VSADFPDGRDIIDAGIDESLRRAVMKFEEAIAYFKEKEQPEDALLLIPQEKGDVRAKELQAIIIAWPKIMIERTKGSSGINGSDQEIWDGIWRQVEYDEDEISRATRISAPGKALDVLIANRLIYPDGTVSQYASKALRSILKGQLGI